MTKYQNPPKFIVYLGVAGVLLFTYRIYEGHQSDKRRAEARAQAASTALPSSPNAAPTFLRNSVACAQLGEIAANAFSTKQQGHSLETVLGRLQQIDMPDPYRRQAAESVVIAIYGDSSIRSRAQAHQVAYTLCMN